jgi:quercetin dioxygenase-like cupin family protein
MNVLNLAPSAKTYPEHDHAGDGQEEVYLVLEGDATLRAGERDWRLERGHLAYVPPGIKRSWKPGDRGVTLLALGATPGKAYETRR